MKSVTKITNFHFRDVSTVNSIYRNNIFSPGTDLQCYFYHCYYFSVLSITIHEANFGKISCLKPTYWGQIIVSGHSENNMYIQRVPRSIRTLKNSLFLNFLGTIFKRKRFWHFIEKKNGSFSFYDKKISKAFTYWNPAEYTRHGSGFKLVQAIIYFPGRIINIIIYLVHWYNCQY